METSTKNEESQYKVEIIIFYESDLSGIKKINSRLSKSGVQINNYKFELETVCEASIDTIAEQEASEIAKEEYQRALNRIDELNNNK